MKSFSKWSGRRFKSLITPLAVILVSSFVLTGCGGSTPRPTTAQPTNVTPTTNIMDFPTGSYINTMLLAGGLFRVSWTNSDDTISIGIKAQTVGWLAIAISPGMTKSRSDLIIGSVTGSQVNLIDSYDPGFAGSHPQDASIGGKNDLFDITGSESNGVTTIEFKRRLNTGDKFDIPLVNGINSFVFAFGADDGMATEHSLVGSGEITITLTHP